MLALAAATLLLAGCGSDKEDAAEPEPSDTEHNSADVTFATDMLPHHAQALSMVDLTLGRRIDQEIVGLADQIRATRVPETEMMVDWLNDWDEPVPETSRDHAHADSPDDLADDSDLPGMLSGEELQALDEAPDWEFERLFLEQMIEHHEGAIAMAQTELDEGRYIPVRNIAQGIVAAQQDEIDTMESLLD